MAVEVLARNLTEGADTSNVASYATASISPAADALITIGIYSSTSAGTPNQPTVTGCGLTWELVTTRVSGSQRLTVLRAMKPATLTGTLTIDLAAQAQTGCSWSVDEFTQVDTSETDGEGAVVQFDDDGTTAVTAFTLTMPSFRTGSATLGYAALANADAITPGTGFNELGTATHASPSRRIQSQWKDTPDNTINWTWTNAGAITVIGLEIRPAPPDLDVSQFPRQRARLGRLQHATRASAASPFFRVLGKFGGREVANGGYIAASGTRARLEEVNPFRRVVDGSQLRTKLEETRLWVFAGQASQPVPDGVMELISAQGWGVLPDRSDQQLFYGDWVSYSDWHPGSGEPHKYTDGNETIQTDTDGRVLLRSTEGQEYFVGDLQRLIYAKPGQSITSIAGTFKQWPGATAPEDYWDAYISAMDFPNGTPDIIHHFDLSAADVQDFEVTLPGTDQISFTMERIDGGVSSGYWSQLGGQVAATLHVRGIALSDVYSPSAAVRDICGRLGISDSMVQESGGNVLPFPSSLMSPRQVLDFAALVMDWRWCIWDTGFGPVMDFGPWSTRRWRVLEPRKQFHPVPLTRYRYVRVPFVWAGSISDNVTIETTDQTLPIDNQNIYSVKTVMKDRTAATQIGQVLARYLASERKGGWLRIVTLGDALGNEVSAHRAHAGDEYLVAGTYLRASEKTFNDDEVVLRLDDDLDFVDRVLTTFAGAAA